MPIPVIVNNFATFYAHAKAREKLTEFTGRSKGLAKRAVALQLQQSYIKVRIKKQFLTS